MEDTLLRDTDVYPVSPSRWWVLATASLLAANQSAMWALPGAVGTTFTTVYGMSGDATQLLMNYGCFLFFILAFPSAFALDRYGVTRPIQGAVLTLLLSSVLRCASPLSPTPWALACQHIAAILTAVAGPVAMTLPSRLAQDWFPPEERATATSITAMASQVGGVLVFGAVPFLCPGGDGPGLLRLNCLLAAAALVNTLMAAAHLPLSPPTGPPSPAASLLTPSTRGATTTPSALLKGLATLCFQPAFLAITLAYAGAGGVFSAAGAFIPNNFSTLGASLSTSAWIGVGVNVGSLLLGVGFAMGSDACKGRGGYGGGGSKRILVGVTLGSGVCFVGFAGVVAAFPSSSSTTTSGVPLAVAACLYILGSSLLAAQVALSFDLAAEHAFEVASEGMVLTGISLVMNSVTFVAFFTPSASFYSWINWAQAVCSLGAGGVLWYALPPGEPKTRYDHLHLQHHQGTGEEGEEGGEGEGRGKG